MAIVRGTRTDNILFGTKAKDILQGLGGNDELYGRENNDTLDGGDGNDHLYGNSGNDLFLHSAGKDFFIGGEGTDTVSYAKAKERVYISEVSAYTTGASKGDSFAGIEILIGSNFDDNVWVGYSSVAHGGKGNDYLYAPIFKGDLYGESGNDHLVGGDKADRLFGGIGNDTVTGGDGNDKVYGDGGSDTVGGGDGNDEVYGGAGDDLFVFESGNDTLAGGGGRDEFRFSQLDSGKDVITDFSTLGGDSLRLYTLGNGVKSYEAAMELAETVNGNTTFTFSSEVVLTLNNVDKSEITENMILFGQLL